MSSPTNVRFPDDLNRALTAFADAMGRTKSSVVVQAAREWLDMHKHPGIVFVTTNTGESRAALAGGPQVWMVAESWLQHPPELRDPAEIAGVLGLSVPEVEVALGYWADKRTEIDEVIARHRASQDEALAAWERRRELDVA